MQSCELWVVVHTDLSRALTVRHYFDLLLLLFPLLTYFNITIARWLASLATPIPGWRRIRLWGSRQVEMLHRFSCLLAPAAFVLLVPFPFLSVVNSRCLTVALHVIFRGRQAPGILLLLPSSTEHTSAHGHIQPFKRCWGYDTKVLMASTFHR